MLQYKVDFSAPVWKVRKAFDLVSKNDDFRQVFSMRFDSLQTYIMQNKICMGVCYGVSPKVSAAFPAKLRLHRKKCFKAK